VERSDDAVTRFELVGVEDDIAPFDPGPNPARIDRYTNHIQHEPAGAHEQDEKKKRPMEGISSGSSPDLNTT
jgi:hypothetical protein